MKHVFAKPYEFESEKFDSIEVNLDNFKGSDLVAVKKQYFREGNYSPYPTLDSEFCAMVLARVTGKPVQFFNELPAPEYIKLTNEVSAFLNPEG